MYVSEIFISPHIINVSFGMLTFIHSKLLQPRSIFDISETLTLQRYVNISFETLTLKYFITSH